MIGQKTKNTTLKNLEKFRFTQLYHALLGRLTIFLFPSSTSGTPLESWSEICIFSTAGRNTKKIQRSNLFPSTVFKLGLLEESTVLYRYSYSSRTLLKSSRLIGLKYAISAGYNIRLKNKSFWKGKIVIAYMVTVLWTRLGKFRQVWTSQNRC